MLGTPFSEIEREIRTQLTGTLASGGFDPVRDIEAITVNRWPHGYTYSYNPLFDSMDAGDELPLLAVNTDVHEQILFGKDSRARAADLSGD